jgi:hypothetical protein
VPYYPALKLKLGAILPALVVTYLETTHPAPWDESAKLVSMPVSVDFDLMARNLAVSRRTLGLAYTQIGRWFPDELKRASARRSGREFLAHEHTRYRSVKWYSVVGAKRFCVPHRTIGLVTIRRNVPVVAQLLRECGLEDIATRKPMRIPESASNIFNNSSVAPQLSLSTLPEIMMRASSIAGDRRKTRYIRERKHQVQPAPERETSSGKLTGQDDMGLGADLVARLAARRDR